MEEVAMTQHTLELPEVTQHVPHRAGVEVHLIARGAHLAAMREHGVRVLSPRGDFTARPHATSDPAEVGEVDYVFLGLKAYSYASSGDLLAPLMGPDTAVIAAQNNQCLMSEGRLRPSSATEKPASRHSAMHSTETSSNAGMRYSNGRKPQ
jgi:hypothetical protein